MYCLLTLVFIFQTAYCALQGPTCFSQFDCEHHMLYKLIKIEEDVNCFRTFIDEMKKNQTQAQADQNQQLETALENLNVNITETFKSLKQKAAIGFSVKSPTAGLTSGEITFDKVITNAGDSFNQTSGWFTCKVPGYYFIIASLLKSFYYTSFSGCYVYKNDNSIVFAHTNPGHTPMIGNYATANSVFVHLNKGDVIKLADCTNSLSLSSYSSFSRFLIAADSDSFP